MSAATRLRCNDEQRQIIVIEGSGHASFANCDLPYHVGNVITDRAAQTVTTDSGEIINYDELVLSPGANVLHMKLVVYADTDATLGAQVVGDSGADKRIDVIATAITDLADLELAYAPQFGSAKDPVNDNLVRGEASVQWHELDKRLADGATLVDVRTPGEFAINLPLDELRETWEQLVDKRDVIVHCQVGLRGHLAVTLLRNLGVEAANLDGGYVTWSAGQAATATS